MENPTSSVSDHSPAPEVASLSTFKPENGGDGTDNSSRSDTNEELALEESARAVAGGIDLSEPQIQVVANMLVFEESLVQFEAPPEPTVKFNETEQAENATSSTPFETNQDRPVESQVPDREDFSTTIAEIDPHPNTQVVEAQSECQNLVPIIQNIGDGFELGSEGKKEAVKEESVDQEQHKIEDILNKDQASVQLEEVEISDQMLNSHEEGNNIKLEENQDSTHPEILEGSPPSVSNPEERQNVNLEENQNLEISETSNLLVINSEEKETTHQEESQDSLHPEVSQASIPFVTNPDEGENTPLRENQDSTHAEILEDSPPSVTNPEEGKINLEDSLHPEVSEASGRSVNNLDEEKNLEGEKNVQLEEGQFLVKLEKLDEVSNCSVYSPSEGSETTRPQLEQNQSEGESQGDQKVQELQDSIQLASIRTVIQVESKLQDQNQDDVCKDNQECDKTEQVESALLPACNVLGELETNNVVADWLHDNQESSQLLGDLIRPSSPPEELAQVEDLSNHIQGSSGNLENVIDCTVNSEKIKEADEPLHGRVNGVESLITDAEFLKSTENYECDAALPSSINDVSRVEDQGKEDVLPTQSPDVAQKVETYLEKAGGFIERMEKEVVAVVAPLLQGPSEASPGRSVVEEEPHLLHHIKMIQFKDKKIGIVTQNENGPCPLVAIINVLLLKRQISLPAHAEIVTASKLMEHIGDAMLESVPKNLGGEARLNYEQNMMDAMAVLPKLQTGLDVNVKFTGVKDFEYTPECIIFDLLRVPLFHGWLVDPQETDVVHAIGQAGYNQLVEKVISQKSSTDPDVATEALIIEAFLERSASQLTYHGLSELSGCMNDDEIGVLFRNNHFSTIYKHQTELLQLVTDQGFLGETSVVWETLSSIDGDGQFVDCHFRTVPPKPERAASSESGSANTSANTSAHLSMTAEQQIDHDFLVALSIQEEEQQQQQQPTVQEDQDPVRATDPVVIPQVDNKTTQEQMDMELARQLQQEEERQAAEVIEKESVAASGGQSSRPSPSSQPQSKNKCTIL